MSEAARKVLRFHFSRMLKHEAGTIDGGDVAELHDMRVAVRRMRAAVRLFRPYLQKKQAAYLRKDLRRLGRALGPARDYDVMLANLEVYRADLPAQEKEAIGLVVRRWQKQRARARKAMLAYLASKRYGLLKQRVRAFLEGDPPVAARTVDGNGVLPATTPLQEPLVESEIPSLLASRYEKLLAYGPSLHGASVATLHALRIDCKRLRYALEFFRESLPPQAAAAIEDIKRAQDHLGVIQDAYVAGRVLRKLLEKWQHAHDDARYPAAAREALCGYLAHCDDRVRTNAHAFPVVWENLTGLEFRQRMHEIATTLP